VIRVDGHDQVRWTLCHMDMPMIVL
jgi:hypothetical protein